MANRANSKVGRRGRAAIVDFFGGLGALVGALVGFEQVYPDASAAGSEPPCKAMTGETVGECISTMAAAGLVPFAVSIAAFGLVGLLVGLVFARSLRSLADRRSGDTPR